MMIPKDELTRCVMEALANRLMRDMRDNSPSGLSWQTTAKLDSGELIALGNAVALWCNTGEED